MRKSDWLLLLIAVIGLAALASMRGNAADKNDKYADSEKIAELVKKLGSDNFEDRESANKELDAIGAPALEALRKAAKSEDAETRMRAEKLVKNIEKRLETARLLQPTMVRLKYKDLPVKDAIAELSKASGCNIVLHDPDNKIGDRKITIETPEISFWEALDRFCKEAKLEEAKSQDIGLTPLAPGFAPGVPALPAVPLVPAIPTVPPGIGGVAPPPPAPKVDAPKDAPKDTPKKEADTPKKEADTPKKEADTPAKPKPTAPAKVEAQADEVPGTGPVPGVGGPVRPVPPGAGAGAAWRRPLNGGAVAAPGTIVLTDGNPAEVPTCYSGSIRIRALVADPKVVQAGEDEQVFILEVTPEPKLLWQGSATVRIDKAIDELEQSLAQVALKDGEQGGVVPGPIPGGLRPAIRIRRPISMVGPMKQEITVRLKKGDKESKLLKEAKGIITAQLRAPAETMITVDNILKASGTTVKGDNGGSIKVIEASKDDDGLVKVRVELDYPQGVFPAGQAGGGMVFPGGRGGIRILPAPVPAPLPAPPIPPPPGGGVNFQLQVGPAPAAPPVGPARGGFGGGAFVQSGSVEGLTLVDDKGNTLNPSGTGISVRVGPGGVINREITLQFQMEKDAPAPAKLIFSGSRNVAVDIPFSLKNVPLRK
jgi:hypothetical protein